MKPESQVDRLIRYLRTNPGASSLEIVRDCLIVNTTGRISDIRALPGYDVRCDRRKDGRDGYWLVEPRPVTQGETVPLWERAS